MLTDDVGWRAHLEVVLLVITRHEIRVIEGNAIVGVGAEEQRLRGFSTSLCRGHIGPQRKNARLREVPAGLVELDVELKRCCFVSTCNARRISVVVHAGIGKRSARFARQTVGYEVRCGSVRLVTRMQALFVILHRRDLRRGAGLSNALCSYSYQFLAEVETIFNVRERTAGDDVSRQAAVIDRIERWMWRAMSSDGRAEEWITRNSCCRHRRHR